MERLTIECQDFGRSFTFFLNTRSIQLTPDICIQYYWMDPGRLRDKQSLEGHRNVQNTIALYRGAVHFHFHDDEQVLKDVVAALAFLETRSDKSTQRVLRDAFPSQSVTARQKRGEILLSGADASRLKRMVKSRDRSAVLQELDRILDYTPLPEEEVECHSRTFDEWIGEGIAAIRTGGREIKGWLQDLKSRIRALRRKRGTEHRAFLNAFAYECKVSFYHCYSNAWAARLIPWLIKNRELDPISQRFLKFWHCQQRPVAIPHGVTAGGILYPTRITKGLHCPDGRVLWAAFPTERIGPDHLPAVFRGQVLALHPLSAFFMNDPACCLTAGQFFGSDSYDRVFERGGGERCVEYWQLIRAILESAIRYRDGQRSYEEGRSSRPRVKASSGKTPTASKKLPSPEDRDLQDRVCAELIQKRHKLCPKCHVPLEFRSASTVTKRTKKLMVRVACNQCQDVRTADISVDEFREELTRLA